MSAPAFSPECRAFREDTTNRQECTAERRAMLADQQMRLRESFHAGRREAFEEAARVVERDVSNGYVREHIAAAIRALAEKTGEKEGRHE